MADNFNFSQGTGTAGAADDIDGVLYPRVKLVIGANNTNDGDVASANPLPVTGTVTANLGATDNAVLDQLELNQDAQTALLTTIDTDTSKIPSPGQALAAASMPVVLPEAQITALTPPAAISGFATSAKQDTLIGHVDGVETLLGTIDADTSTLAGAVAGTEVQVDVVSSALPTGASTAAKQPALGTAGTASSDVITIQGINSMTPLAVTQSGTWDEVGINDSGNSITVDGSVTATLSAETTKVIGTVNVAASQTIAVTQATAGNLNMTEANSGAIKTAVEALDNAISGSEMQVDVVAALPAGTNAIGKLAANSGVDIGDVDVLSLPALAAGTNTIGKVAPNEYELAGNTTHVKKYYTNAGAATDGIIWSPAAGKRWYVTDIFIQVSAAATVTLEDDLTAGDSAVWKAELAANSGWSHSFTTPLFSGEDAADLLITTTAGNVYVTCTGYEI